VSNIATSSAADEKILCRAVRADEIDAALRLILSTAYGAAETIQIEDFLRFAEQRNVDLKTLKVAEELGQMKWAALPLVSAGRTMLIFAPSAAPLPSQIEAAKKLTCEVVAEYRHREVDLAQVLIDPDAPAVRALYEACGFWALAELVYLQRRLSGPIARVELPAGMTFVAYSPSTQEEFARTIAASYRDSFDCPRLNGLRKIEDVVAGHKATGEFDPSQWLLLREGAAALGVLLLSRAPRSDSMELVYLGLAPEARGRGIARLLMRQAMSCTLRAGLSRLCLAVDSLNQPAIKLYHAAGMSRVGSRLAMLRDLRAS
jgi:mycothiol synthase